jgi:protein-disulfide isomerase
VSNFIPLRLTAALAITAIAASCSSGSSATPDVASAADAADSSSAGEVNGQKITVSELDEWIRNDLFEQQAGSEQKLYELRAGALSRMIDERIVAGLASQAGIDEDALIAREVAAIGAVTDEQVTAFYEENQARLARRGDLETLTPQIRQFLESEQPNAAIAKLREGADIRIDLTPPRIQVAATGPSRGAADAPITIVAFSDYQCPFCSRAEPVMQEVLDRYPGKVRLIYRHLPLNFHADARPAAAASICAEEQEKFWEYHELLFANQRQLGGEALAGYATELGLDLEAFNACLDSEATNARIDVDLAEARAAGASGTPAFFINGIPLSGALPADQFAEVIDAELARLAAAEGSAS